MIARTRSHPGALAAAVPGVTGTCASPWIPASTGAGSTGSGIEESLPSTSGSSRSGGSAASMGVTAARNQVVDLVTHLRGGTSIVTPAGHPGGSTPDTPTRWGGTAGAVTGAAIGNG